jgi:hypothetical protein
VLIDNTVTDEYGNDKCIMLALKRHNPDKTYMKSGAGHKVHGVSADELVKLEEVDEPTLDRFIEFAEKEFNCRDTATSGKDHLLNVIEAASSHLESLNREVVAINYQTMTPKQKRDARKRRTRG